MELYTPMHCSESGYMISFPVDDGNRWRAIMFFDITTTYQAIAPQGNDQNSK